MKKREVIIHGITVLVLGIALFAKSQRWPWSNNLFVTGLSTLSFVWMACGQWIIQPPKVTHPILNVGLRALVSIPYSLFFMALLGIFQHYPWATSALTNCLILLCITSLLILLIRSRVDKLSQKFWTALCIRQIVFILFGLFFLWVDIGDYVH